jgi:L-malate glycosyltransferase
LPVVASHQTPMRIGLYIEHGVGDGIGGAELKAVYLASAWSREHRVDLIHHRPPLTHERLALFTSDDLSNVTFRYVVREPEPPAYRNLFQRYRAARDWHGIVSDGYDIFLNFTHWVPCFCHANSGMVVVLFPFYVRPERSESMATLPAWKRLRHGTYFGWEWQRRIATYQHWVTNSEFSRDWTLRRWGIDCDVVYPPVSSPGVTEKRPLILSVGRFSTMTHSKKQLELMHAFAELQQTVVRDWTYASVGGLNSRPENRHYFEQVKAAGRGSFLVEANLSRDAVCALFRSARIFWHATGFNDDTDTHPELAEHFGIATAEAMGAGCVPVVVNKGGQREVVRHGVDGFLWNTIDELKHYTRLLAEDTMLWERMSSAARVRAQAFSRERFLEQMSRRVGISVPPYAVDARRPTGDDASALSPVA